MSECMITPHGKTGDGYGQFKVRGVSFLCHRLVYELVHGSLGPGEVVRHVCDTPGCVNPQHLVVGTHKDNANDRKIRGRGARGQRHGLSKVTDEDVPRIRMMRAEGAKLKDIAASFGVCISTISQICNRKTWEYVP